MRFVIKFLLCALLLVVVIGPFALVPFALDDAPVVTLGEPPTVDDLERLKELLKENDPRRLREGETREVTLTERDINFALEYLLSRLQRGANVTARAELRPGRANLAVSIPLPDKPLRGFINMSLALVPAQRGVVMEQLRIGRIPVPRWLPHRLLALIDAKNGDVAAYRELQELAGALSRVQFRDGDATLALRWRQDLQERMEGRGRELVVTEQDRERLIFHYGKLAGVMHSMTGGSAPLLEALKPMMAFAAVRTQAGYDPGAENRSALLALALYAVGDLRDVRRLVGDEAAGRLARSKGVALTLLDRADLAAHFLASAALTGSAGSEIADVLGAFEEVQHSRRGVGFSFTDLAADRAGVRFARLAASKAVELQRRVATLAGEAELLPSVDALPEEMMESEFIKRFENGDSEAYHAVSTEIERRINACKLYR
ncbi:MAG: hypothetical protein ACT4NU_03495 [Chromatiales bacterium]